MSDTAIRVANLGKQYRIGGKQAGNRTFREALLDSFALPVRWIRGERKAFETFWALDDVSFEVKQGEAVGIIGRNGAGKSTLLKVLSRITKPTKGRVDLYGRVASLLEVGTGFHPELSGRDNIYLNGAILGMSHTEIEHKFDEILDFSGVEKFLDTAVKHYSSGMYMRLAFAVAAHLEPEILVVDEVLAVGDFEFQKKCLQKMGDVVNAGSTVLFVSHSMDSIRRFCTRAISLENGRLKENGPVDVVIPNYLNADGNVGGTDRIILPESGVVISGVEQINGLEAASPGRATLLSISDPDGKPKSAFYLWEPWSITLEFEIFRPVKHFIAAIALVSVEGVTVITYWSKPKDLLPGKYSVEFPIDLPLAAGDIQFVVGLSSFERSIYYREKLGKVSILDVVKEGNQPIRTRGSGMLITQPKAEIMKMD